MLTAGKMTRGGESYHADIDLIGDFTIRRVLTGSQTLAITIESHQLPCFDRVTSDQILDIYYAGLRHGVKDGRDAMRASIEKAIRS